LGVVFSHQVWPSQPAGCSVSGVSNNHSNHSHNQQQQQQEEQEEEQYVLKNTLGRRCSCHALALCGGCIGAMIMEGSR